MRFKLKNIVLVSLLAVAGIFGASAAAIAKDFNETKTAEKAEAASTSTSATIYFSWSGSWGVDPYVSYCAGSTWTHMNTKCGTSGTSGTGSVTVPANTNTVIFAHRNADGSSWWGQTSNMSIEIDSTKGLKNQLTITCNSSSFGASWTWNTGLSNTIKYNNNGGSGTISNQTIWLDNATLSNGSSFSKTGYTLSSWNTESDGTGTSYSKSANVTYKNFPNYVNGSTVTLYAQWTPTVYTITYDRNKNTGLQATQSKNYGTNVTAYTPGSSPITATGWDPSTYKRFLHWNTEYNDSGTIYEAGGTISSNSSFTLYYIEDWYNYRYRINSGSWIELVHNDEGKASDVQAQFAPASAQTLPLNGIISLQYSSDGKSSWNDLTSVTFDGNYDTSTGIKLETVDTIYLKIMNSNAYECWVPGISDRTIAVFNSSSATTGGKPYSMRGNGDSETVTTEEVVIEKGQFVRRGYAGNYTYGSYFAGGAGTAASCFQQVGSDTAVECLKTGVYTVYNQKGGYDNWNDIYFTRNEAASAKYLAQQFNTIIAAICTDIVGGSKSLSNLQAVWGNVTSSTLYKHFNGQVSDTMAYFKTSSSTTDPDILACVTKYDYIENKYGTDALPDFIARNNGYKKSASRDLSPFALIGSEDNFSTIIIIISSSVALLSVTALSILVIRKRRSKEIE